MGAGCQGNQAPAPGVAARKLSSAEGEGLQGDSVAQGQWLMNHSLLCYEASLETREEWFSKSLGVGRREEVWGEKCSVLHTWSSVSHRPMILTYILFSSTVI